MKTTELIRVAVLTLAVCVARTSQAEEPQTQKPAAETPTPTLVPPNVESSPDKRVVPFSKLSRQQLAAVQRALAARGYYKGPIDGKFGRLSVAALHDYQTWQEMEPRGKLTAQTLGLLGLEDIQVEVVSGDSGPSEASIRVAQQKLKSLGFYRGELTGKMELATREAIREFQLTFGLQTTAELDDATIGLLALSSRKATPEPAKEPSKETPVKPAAPKPTPGP